MLIEPSSKWRLIDLFSGIGGFSLAAQWTERIETLAFCEIEPFCQRVLKKNFPGVPIYDDITTLTARTLHEWGVGPIDLLCGGFPCQGISVAGRGRGLEDSRSALWYEMLRLIRELRPTWLVAENVARLKTLGADTVLEGLEGAGYAAWPFVVGADDVSAPHQRKRVWIVARRDEGMAHPLRSEWGQSPEGWDNESDRTDSRREETTGGPELCRQAVAHTCQQGLQERCGETRERPYATTPRGMSGTIEPSLGNPDHGISRRLVGRWPARQGEDQKDWEAPRIARGVDNRVACLKALGNAIIPEVAYHIFMTILSAEDMLHGRL